MTWLVCWWTILLFMLYHLHFVSQTVMYTHIYNYIYHNLFSRFVFCEDGLLQLSPRTKFPTTLGECVRLSAFRKSSLISTLTRLQQWIYFRCLIPCLTHASYNKIWSCSLGQGEHEIGSGGRGRPLRYFLPVPSLLCSFHHVGPRQGLWCTQKWKWRIVGYWGLLPESKVMISAMT